jgi:gluconokinase
MTRVDGPSPGGGAPPDEVVVGLDVGTTATKAVAFGLSSSSRQVASREYPLRQPEPGWQVQDPEEVRSAVLATLAEVVSASGGPVLGICVSTAMHGLIGLARDGRPLTPLVTWADARSVPQARRLKQSGAGRSVYRTSGSPIHPMTPLTKLMWFTEHEPELSARVRHWVGLKDYVLAALTGQLVTEASSASGTALWDLATGQWSPPALALAGITADQLPPILATTTALPLSPAAADTIGLPAGTPVVVGAADGPLGNLGTGALDPGVAGLSIGTSGAVRMLVEQPALDPDGRLFCYALTPDHWVVGGAVSNGGEVARWAGRVFGADLLHDAEPGTSADAALLALAEAVPAGSEGLLMLPYLLAERAPLWDPELTGAFLGIRHGHTRGHFVRAAVEGVALQLSAIVERLDRLAPVTSLRATGGVFRSPLWRRVVAGALDKPVTISGSAEGTALGAAALGLYALGRAETLPAAAALLRTSVPETVLAAEPADVARYAQLRASVPTLLNAYREVTDMFSAMDRPGPQSQAGIP